jgi:HD-like signal output (HDOD) protein
MDNSPGFAGLGKTVQTICDLVDNDGDNSEIVATIMRDPLLTSKLLHIANSSSYARGAGNISTIDKTITLLGLNTVKSIALSLALLNSLSNKPQSNQLHAEIVTAFFSGNLAAAITRIIRINLQRPGGASLRNDAKPWAHDVIVLSL